MSEERKRENGLLLTHEERIGVAKEITEALKRKLGKQLGRVFLYGSVALGTDGPDSDTDLLVTYVGNGIFDKDFHRRVVDILNGEGIPLGRNTYPKTSNTGRVTIVTCSEHFYHYPWAYDDPNPMVSPFEKIHFVEGIKKYGVVFFEKGEV